MAVKILSISKHPNAEFKKLALDPKPWQFCHIKIFIGNNFAGLAYTEPLYLKEFYSRQWTKRGISSKRPDWKVASQILL